MLVPAITKKDELERLFMESIYSEDYFWYSGYLYAHELPDINIADNDFKYAIVDNKRVVSYIDNEKVVGYLAYKIDPSTDTVYNFGLLSFDKGNPTVGVDLFKEMERLVAIHRRIEWRMVGGNPVQRHYDKFCKKHGGNIVTLHDVCKGPDGMMHDSLIYEIVRK